MVRVPDWSEEEFQRRTAELGRLIRRAWRAVARAVSGRLDGQSVAAAAQLPSDWSVEVEDQVLGYVAGTYIDAAQHVVETLGAPADVLVGDDLVAYHLRAARNRLRDVGDDVWQVVREQLALGNQVGESIPELAARVRATAGVSDARSLTIARTEVHAAHEAGSYDQALFVDPNATKIWLATNDSRTRETHRRAEGQRRKLSEPFDVGGSALRYPGDPLGDPGETINCRCTVTYDFDRVTTVQESNDELALVAATKKWNPSAHPRGNDGKFIKKGAVSTLLSKQKPLITDVTHAVAELDAAQWAKLTDAQKDYVANAVNKLPEGSQLKKSATAKLAPLVVGAESSSPASSQDIVDATGKSLKPGTAAHSALTKGNYDFWDAVAALDQNTWNSLTDEQRSTISSKAYDYQNESDWESQEAVSKISQLSALQKPVKPVAPVTTVTPTPAKIPAVPSAAVSAHKGATPGSPAKVTTGLIWGKYEPGTVILEAPNEQVVWDGKKYNHYVSGSLEDQWTKKDAYAQLKGDTHWQVPGVVQAESDDSDKATWQKQWEKGLVTTEEFNQKFGEDPVGSGVTLAPPPPPPLSLPKKAAKKVAKKGQSTFTPQLKSSQQLLLELQNDGILLPSQAVTLVNDMDQADWDGLTETQRIDLAVKVDFALDNGSFAANQALAKLGQLQQAEAPAASPPSPAMAIPATTPTGTIDWSNITQGSFAGDYPAGSVVAKTTDDAYQLVQTNSGEFELQSTTSAWSAQFNDADLESGAINDVFPDKTWQQVDVPPASTSPGADLTLGDEIEDDDSWQELLDKYGDVKVPTTIAQSSNDKYRLVAHPGAEYAIEMKIGDNWHDVETFSTAALADEDQSIGEVMTSHHSTWYAAQDVVETPIAPSPETFQTGQSVTLTEGKKYLIDTDHPVGTVVGRSAIGNERLVRSVGNTPLGDKPSYQREMLNAAGDWIPVESGITGIGALQIIRGTSQSSSPDPTWIVPQKLLESTLGGSSSAPDVVPSPSSTSLSYTGEDVITNWPGVATGVEEGKYVPGATIALSADGKYKLVKTSYEDDTLVVDAESGEYLVGYNLYGLQHGLVESDYPGTWVVPPPDTVPTAPPTPPAPAPAAQTGDTSSISAATKKYFKQHFKAGGVGYWSKPEKIWDQVKKIQELFPHPSNEGESEYSSLQILKSLDEQLKTKEPDPYQAKMIKWAATPAGKAYTGNTGSLAGTPSAQGTEQVTPTPTPVTFAKTNNDLGKLWLAATSDVPPGTVIAVKTVGSTQHQAVVQDVPGTGKKYVQLQYKSDATGGHWADGVSLKTEGQFLNVIKFEEAGQSWQITAVKSPAVVTTPNVPTGPTPFTQTAAEVAAKLFTVSSGIPIAVATGANGTKYKLTTGYTLTPSGKISKKKQFFIKMQTPTGAWVTSKQLGASQYKVSQALKDPQYQWMVPDPAATATPAPPSVAAPVTLSAFLGDGDVADISPAKQQQLYVDFKKQPATYLDSPATDIYAAASTLASDNGISLLEMLRVIDIVGAQKVSKPNEHLFEKKIKDWLKTPQGAAIASGKPIPLPETPKLAPGVSFTAVKPFEQTNGLDYQVISTSQADQLQKQAVAASSAGEWTTTQRAGLKAYTGGVYYSINKYLYGGLDSISPTNEKTARNAQAGMRPSVTAMLLHRGVGYDGVGGAKSHADIEKMIGQTWKSGGFFSTSVGGKAAFGGSVLIEVEAPPGTPMAYLKPISNYSTENEMLLAAGTHFRIISAKKVGTKTVVRMRVVPPPPEVNQ